MIFRLGVFGVLIVLLVAVMFFAYSILNQSKPGLQEAMAPTPPSTEMVLVAAGPLSAGSLLQPSNIASASVLIANAPQGALADTPQNRAMLTGSMVRAALGQGSPILDLAVIHPGDHGFLAAVLEPGMRAVTVSVDNVTGANGLIWPGDNVDVLLTQTIPGAPDNKSIVAEVVLRNVRVIATGSELIKDAGTNAKGSPPAQTVTLEVTPDQASRCLVATNLGRLSLIVHSAQTAPGPAAAPEPAQQPVWSGDVSPALTNSQQQQAPVSTLKVFQGSSNEQDYKF